MPAQPLSHAISTQSNTYTLSVMTSFSLYFNRHLKGAAVVPPPLQNFVEGEHFLSTKQVASATLLRGAGSASVKDRAELLRSSGFTLTDEYDVSSVTNGAFTDGTNSESVDSPHDLFREAARQAQGLAEEAHVSVETPPSNQTSGPRSLKLVYEDPWLIIAGRTFATTVGRATSPPSIHVWSGDGHRIQDPLPRRLLGPDWTGGGNQVRFHEIGDLRVKWHVISRHTHWGHRLSSWCHSHEHGTRSIKAWAKNLRRRLRALLEGRSDPVWTPDQKAARWEDPAPRSARSRALRLIELLKTVDGIFLQRYLAYPEEVWTWERYDTFILANLAVLMDDEFLDGTLTEEASAIVSRYQQLKDIRKQFKQLAHTEKLAEFPWGEQPQWLTQYVHVYERVETERKLSANRYAQLVGIFSQTRGCGTPPPLVILQSKMKFLRVTRLPVQPLGPTKKALIQAALSEITDSLPADAFTGLSTKARITVTTSACWEKTRKEGGTLGYIHEIVYSGKHGVEANIFDLDTGEFVESRKLEDFDSPGEYIFWRCLDYVLRMSPEELRNAYLTVVKEPGKGRSVTKGRACLKVVLDTISKICAEPMKKGLASSKSGMGMSHHGWNFFKSFFEGPGEDLVFSEASHETTAYHGYEEHHVIYHRLFVSSTDYKTATDYMLHEFASMASEKWMLKCGIPPILRGIVHATCYQPRRIYFSGSGPLKSHGDSAPEMGDDIRYITLYRGVLMGDPLTKIVLHLSNAVARIIGAGMESYSFLSSVFTNPAAIVLD